MKEKNYNVINVTTSNSNNNENTNNSNCFVPQKKMLHTENSALCNLDITDNTVSDADLYDSDSTITNPLLVQDNPVLCKMICSQSYNTGQQVIKFLISHLLVFYILFHLIAQNCLFIREHYSRHLPVCEVNN